MAKTKKVEDPVVVELDAIKRLLVLQLLLNGATQGDVAHALQVDQSVVSRMFPARKLSFSKSKK